jgi:hypothetical protein
MSVAYIFSQSTCELQERESNDKSIKRSSIDWTLLGDDGRSPSPSRCIDDERNDELAEKVVHDNTMSALRGEELLATALPNYIDRLSFLEKSDCKARWYPYVYEVVIFQWAAILLQQKAANDYAGNLESDTPFEPQFGASEVDSNLNQAASRSVGVAVACAPMLFEIIKQSLGARVSMHAVSASGRFSDIVNSPIISLDDQLFQHLEHIVVMITDACIDSRNFDTWELRQMSVEVNDAVVRFLRDMFSFLVPRCVHRLCLSYFSRFVTKDGKQWQDRASMIGLRCSWEVTKLRLNAVTTLVRFPDFLRINSPQMLNWQKRLKQGVKLTSDFVSDIVIKQYEAYRLLSFVVNDEKSTVSNQKMPLFHPHWLAEVVVDVCLLGTEHADQGIQYRSSSLLFELFWSCSQASLSNGQRAPVASMYLTLLEKLLQNVSYFAHFAPKSQVRKDLILCSIFVMQSTPPNLLRSLWRKLCRRLLAGGGQEKRKSDWPNDACSLNTKSLRRPGLSLFEKEAPDVFDMFSFLNLSLRTVEYEGCDEHVGTDGSGSLRSNVDEWRAEFLLGKSCLELQDPFFRRVSSGDPDFRDEYTSTASRRWQSHDASMVIVNTAHQIVLEMSSLLRSSLEGRVLLNPAAKKRRIACAQEDQIENSMDSLMSDVVLFVRAATSLLLHSLALRGSDIAVTRTLKVGAECIKIFGIKIFLDAVGETLQHWMRMILLHCGARRAQVRISATDLLELVLRSTWEGFGSFFRIRVPVSCL